jgi:hypothetical protein
MGIFLSLQEIPELFPTAQTGIAISDVAEIKAAVPFPV